MRKHRRCLAVVVAAVSFLLSGCGAQVYEMTAAEEELIVQYAAHFVSKYNIYQQDGVVYVGAEADTEDSDKSDDTATQKPENSEKPDKPSNRVESIEEAIGLSGNLEITYKGSEVKESLKQGNAYLVTPNAGNALFVMNFDVKNVSDKAVEMNHLLLDLQFKLESGKVVSTHRETFLNNDFSTYIGSIAAGETVNMVLIFEAKESDVKQIVSPSLQITVDGKKKMVEL